VQRCDDDVRNAILLMHFCNSGYQGFHVADLGIGEQFGFEGVGNNKVCIPAEGLICGYYVLAHIQAAFVAHDRVEDFGNVSWGV